MAFEIKLSVGELSSAAAALGRVADTYDRIAGSQQAIATSARGTRAGGGAAGGAGSGPAGGPMQALQRAQVAMYEALQRGSGAQVFDAQVALQRAQAGVARARAQLDPPAVAPKVQPSPAQLAQQRMLQALTTSRFGAGGMQPLVGRSLAALGFTGAAAGPAALVTTGLMLLSNALKGAVDAANQFSAATSESGGRGRDVATLTGLGVSAQALSGVAASLRERMSSDAFGAAAASRLGVGPVAPRPHGPVNEAKLLVDTLKALRLETGKVRDAEEQLALARMLGLESMVALLKVSQGVFAGIEQDAQTTERIQDPQTQRAAADAQAGFNRLGQALSNLTSAALEPLLPLVGLITNSVASALSVLADWLNTLNSIPTKITQFLSDLVLDPANAFKNLFEGKDGATDANTKALQDNTRALKSGTFGGAERLRGALPAHLRGEMFRQAMEGGTVTLGGFAAG